jgi:hypothetical protein
MNRFKLLAFFGTIFVSSISCAEQSTPPGDINTIYFYLTHTGVLIKHTTMLDPDACGRKDFYILPDSHLHFKEIYSLLLAAQMADKKVSLAIAGCHQGIPAIVHVALTK